MTGWRAVAVGGGGGVFMGRWPVTRMEWVAVWEGGNVLAMGVPMRGQLMMGPRWALMRKSRLECLASQLPGGQVEEVLWWNVADVRRELE